MVVSALFLVLSPALAKDRIPNDPFYGQQWYLKHIGVPEAWNTSLGLEQVIVAVIDSGVDIDHPDLKPNIWRNPGEVEGNNRDNDNNGFANDVHGWNFIGNNNDPRPVTRDGGDVLAANHGTIAAGIIAARADNGMGIAGVTWQTTIMPIRALDENGQGDPEIVAEAVDYAVKNGAKIINLSFSGPEYSQRLADALKRAYDAGVFVVAAAGNAPEGGNAIDLDKNPQYPVCLDENSSEHFIYGVAATDDKDQRAQFSNYGAGCVDISAPGTRVVSTQAYRQGSKDFSAPYGGYYNGTSVAAPIVSGVAALLVALDHSLTPKQIANILLESSVNIDAQNVGFFGKIGRGRIDAAAAVRLVTNQRQHSNTVTTASLIPPGSPQGIIVTAPGSGAAPDVRMFTADGLFIRSFAAFPNTFTGGVSLASGDFDGNGKQAIVVAAQKGGLPQVRIFDRNATPIGGFLAYDSAFRGGVNVAVGDIDGNKRDDIITGAAGDGGPQIRIFSAQGQVRGSFFAFEQNFRGGVRVATGDLDGGGQNQIIAGSGPGRISTVRVYRGNGSLIREFHPFGDSDRGGVTLCTIRLDGDTADSFIVYDSAGAGVLYSRGVRMGSVSVDERGIRIAGKQTVLHDALPYVVGSDPRRMPVVTSVAPGSGIASAFLAYDRKFFGGVSAVALK